MAKAGNNMAKKSEIIYWAHDIYLNVVLQPNTTNQHQIYNSCGFIQKLSFIQNINGKCKGFLTKMKALGTHKGQKIIRALNKSTFSKVQ